MDKALSWGAVPIYRGSLDPSRFIEGQDTAAYQAQALLAPPGASRLMHEEPFGPVDTIVVVDTEAELLTKMNASNGALVASIACDDAELAAELAEHVQVFKVGVNKPRSHGDKLSPSAGAARHGRARSSAATTSCRPSRKVRRASGSTETSRGTAGLPTPPDGRAHRRPRAV